MGREGHVQVRHAEYGCVRFTDWGQSAAASWLDANGINVYTGDPSGMSVPDSSDHWEIEIPDKAVPKKRGPAVGYVTDYGRIQEAIDRLRKHPDALDEYLDEGFRGRKFGESLADLLDEGLRSAKKHEYSWINIDWF